MRTRIPILIAALAFLPAAAAPAPSASERIQQSLCPTQLRELLNRWAPTRQWTRVIGQSGSSETFRSPTLQIGRWVELRFSPEDKTIEAIRITPRTSLFVRWNGPDCSPEIRRQERALDAKAMIGGFTDEDLEKAVESGKSGIVFAWSPHMPLSLKSYAEAERAARKLGLDFIPVLDPQTDPRALEDASRKAPWVAKSTRKIQSVELELRDITLHFPSIIVFGQRKILSPVYPGHKSQESYERFIRRFVPS